MPIDLRVNKTGDREEWKSDLVLTGVYDGGTSAVSTAFGVAYFPVDAINNS